MNTPISNWLFDLTKPVYLIHPNYKFWQVKQEGKNISFRVGKLQNDRQDKIEQVSKLYTSIAVARTTMITKIEQKLTKGYIPKNPIQIKKQEQKKQKERKKQQNIKKKQQNKQQNQQSNQKINQIKSQNNNIQLRIKRIDKNNGKLLNKNTILSQQNQIKSQKQPSQQQLTKNIKKNNSSKKTNFLSVTKMTDDAISHNSSRNLSSHKSNQSYQDDNDNDDNSNLPSRLGKPTSQPISVLLAQTWQTDVDPTNWIMSEKLDGVRCFWTGTTMYSRNAKRFYCPKFFTKGWPKSQMDGELFIGRGKFSQTVSVVRKNVPIDEQWKKVKYLVFDCPGLNAPFTQRLKQMQKVIREIDNPYLKCHAHRICSGFQDLFQQLNQVIKNQGEGLMLRDPNSKYQNRRSKSLLKVKQFYDDQAEIIGYKPGTGRCQNMVGALRVRNTKGVEFEVGSGMDDKMRKKPPKLGTIITYKYQQFNKDSGKPRFPIFLRIYTKI